MKKYMPKKKDRKALRYCEKELEILRSQLAWLKSELNKTF